MGEGCCVFIIKSNLELLNTYKMKRRFRVKALFLTILTK